MKRDKLLALGAYGIQAASTFGVVFLIGHLLEAAHYGSYSFVVATSQTASVIATEWIRLSAMRFCSGAVDNNEHRVATVQCTFFAVCGLLLCMALMLGLSGHTPLRMAMMGAVVAVLQAATDLQLVFLRVRGSFGGFAKLQGARAAILLICPVAAAWWSQTAVGTLAGLSLGYLLSMALFVSVDLSWWRVNPKNFQASFLLEMMRYGMAAAGASMTHSLAPMAMRWTGQSTMNVQTFAGFSLALDLLQKPYALVTSALGGILTPGVIQEHEQGSADRPQLRRMYEAQTWAVIVLAGSALAFIPEASSWLVKAPLQAAFLAFAPICAFIFALHVGVQTILATPGHLLKHGRGLITNALVEVGLVGAVCAAVLTTHIEPGIWLWACVVAVLITDLFGLRLVRLVPCQLPKGLLTAGPVVGSLLACFYFWPTHNLPTSAGKALAFTMTVLLCGAWVKRMLRNPTASTADAATKR